MDIQVAQSFQTSLENLQTGYLDGLILHSPLSGQEKTYKVWQAMEALVRNGGVKQIGISNCYDFATFENLYRFAEIKPAVIQNRFYANTGYDRRIRDFCREHGISYQCFWTLTANPHVLADPSVRHIAELNGRSPAQVFFRYLTQIGVVPLTGTTSVTHMKDDLALFDFELTPEECAAVEKLLH